MIHSSSVISANMPPSAQLTCPAGDATLSELHSENFHQENTATTHKYQLPHLPTNRIYLFSIVFTRRKDIQSSSLCAIMGFLHGKCEVCVKERNLFCPFSVALYFHCKLYSFPLHPNLMLVDHAPATRRG